MNNRDTDIGTEELAHFAMTGAIVYQLTHKLPIEEIKRKGFDAYFVDHTLGIFYPQSAASVPFTAAYLHSKGDPITDLVEDMVAEQKARTTYDNILKLVDNYDVAEPIKFLREREIVHFRRFCEALGNVREKLNSKNFYYTNPAYNNGFKIAEKTDINKTGCYKRFIAYVTPYKA